MFCSATCRKLQRKSKLPNERLIKTFTNGAAGELFAALDLLKNGYHVFRNISPNGPFDLIAMKYNKLIKIEVRSGMFTNTYKLNKRNDKYKLGRDFDVYALVSYDGAVEYHPKEVIEP